MRLALAFTFLIIFHAGVWAQLYNTGLVFNDEKYNEAPTKPVIKRYSSDKFPTAFSLKIFSPRPGNQLQLNSSAAWATTWSALGILSAKHAGVTDADKISAEGFSPAYVMAHIKLETDADCGEDLDIYDALKFIFSKPLALHRDIDEFCPSPQSANLQKLKTQSLAGGFTRIIEPAMTPAYKIDMVKKSISNGYPVVVGMLCPPSFQQAHEVWQPSEIESDDLPGQALCVVSYDDKKYGGAFEVLNSWGSRWGNGGFMWIRYEDFVRFAKHAYDLFFMQNGTSVSSGSALLRLNNEKDIPVSLQSPGIYSLSQPLKTNTFFRLYMTSKQPCYGYVFGVDESMEFFRIFPHSNLISPAMIFPNEETPIPGEDNYIQLTGRPGNEKLYLLYTKKSLDIDQLLKDLKAKKGDILDNIEISSGQKIFRPNEVTWEENKLQFDAKSDSQSMVVVQIDIRHL